MSDTYAFLNKLIKDKPTIPDGMLRTLDYAKSNFKEFKLLDIEKIDFKECWAILNKWLEGLLEKEPIGKEIKSLWFGFFEEVPRGWFFKKHTITLYLSGSEFSPEEAADWACDTTYWPHGRYIRLPCEKSIYQEIQKVEDPDRRNELEILLVQASIFLMIINSVPKHGQAILQHRDQIYIGSGYDSGDFYSLGYLDKEGLH